MKTLLITISLFAISHIGWSTDYVTLVDGNWDDPGVWSTDGGVTSCSCFPGATTMGDNIRVNHDIQLPMHLTVNGGSEFIVSTSGSLMGAGFNLETTGNSTIELNGQCAFRKIINGKTNGTNGSNIYISSLVTSNARIDLYAGVLELDGGFIYGYVGNFNVHPNASFYLVNGSKLELESGNISNEGYIHLGEDCCMTTAGNWTNELTGTIEGSGSATTTLGNMKNYNVWSPEITWCSAGFDTGMPSPEDCSVSTNTCGMVMLPVELVAFAGESRGAYNEIYWATASEHNSDYFELYRSYDGFNWELVSTEQAAGNSTEMINYAVIDHVDNHAVAYYRLKQFDVDGAQMRSGIIAVESVDENNELLLFPNPAGNSELVVAGGTNQAGSLILTNAYGAEVLVQEVSASGTSTVLNTRGLQSGIYFVTYLNTESEVIDQEKLIVQ